MKRYSILKKTLLLVAVAGALTIVGSITARAQSGPSLSISYDILPYQDFADPVIDSVAGADTTFFDDPQTQLRKLRASMSLPVVLVKDRTLLINEFSYQLIEFRYRRFDFELERVHAASYTPLLQHRLSMKWSVWAQGTVSMASDLGAEVSENDFNFETVLVFIRHFSERLSIGGGAAYTTQFGTGELVPILGLDWNNGRNLSIRAILPTNIEFWYRPGPRVDLGLLASGDGNAFRGDPAVYQVIDPELRYTMVTVGPAAKISMTKLLKLNIQAGLIALHRFEFFNGDTEVNSFELEPGPYVKVGLQYGG